MTKRIRFLAIALSATVVTAGCATKAQLRQGLEAQAAQQTAALEAERAERIEADRKAAEELVALNQELSGLRRDHDVRIAHLEEGLEFAVPVHFAFDEAEVEEEVRPALDRFTQLVQRHYPGSMITVEGFADPAGPAAYNRKLSERRAEAVRQYLVARGLSEGQLRAIGYGEERPVVPGAAGGAHGAELNRRVVFVVETPAAPGVAVVTPPTR